MHLRMEVRVEEVEQNAIGTLILLLDLGVLEISSGHDVSKPIFSDVIQSRLTVQP